MKVENRVFPNREQMKGFFENADDNEPIFMLNLLKFKAVSYTHLTLPTTR